MAGHSKWANIKHRKGAQDAKRGKVFTKLIKEVTIAAREGGGDPDSNPRLRLAIQNAKGVNVPKDNIERAIKKATGEDSGDYMEVTYEGYGPNGIAVYVEAATDNINRTVAAVRSYFTKHGGSLGTNGSLDFLFDRRGVFIIPKQDRDEEELLLELIEGGAEEVATEGDRIVITTAMEDFGNMQNKLDELNIEAENAKLERIPKNTTTLEVEAGKQVMKLIDVIEEDEDVQNVYHNLELSNELEKALSE